MDLTEEMQKYQRVLREYKEDICVSCHEPYTARDDDPVIGMCLACGEMEYSLDYETNDQQNVWGSNSEEELSEDAPALNIKRYDLEQRGEYDCYGVMEENPYGDWVKYEDVVELLKQSKSLSEHIVKLPNGKYQLRSKKKNKQGKTKNLGTFGSRAAAENTNKRFSILSTQTRALVLISKKPKALRRRFALVKVSTQAKLDGSGKLSTVSSKEPQSPIMLTLTVADKPIIYPVHHYV